MTPNGLAASVSQGLNDSAGGDASPLTKCRNQSASRTLLERVARDGESPVGDGGLAWSVAREYHGTRETLWEAGRTTFQG